MSVTSQRILCVDDNTDTCELLKVAIHNQGYDTTTVRTVRDATAVIATEEFDLFIVNKTFTDGNWLDLLRIVRPQNPNCRFILYSSDPYDPSLKDAIAAGADAHIISDGNIETLIDAIRNLLSK